jgi:hypothetical protein
MRVGTALPIHHMQRPQRVSRGIMAQSGLRLSPVRLGDGPIGGGDPFRIRPGYAVSANQAPPLPAIFAGPAAQRQREQYGRALQHHGLVVDRYGNVIRWPIS